MEILFIKPKHIGDTLLLTPTLTATKQAYPQARISVLVRRGCEGMLAGCPAVDVVHTISPVENRDRRPGDGRKEATLLWKMRQTRYDYIFELGDGHRARWFVAGNRARKKYSVKTADQLPWFWEKQFDGVSHFEYRDTHRVEKDFYSVHEFLPLEQPIPPLTFVRERTQSWKKAEGLKNFCVMHVGTRQGFKQWTDEGWLAVTKFLLGQFEKVIVSTGPDPKEIQLAEKLRQTLGEKVLPTNGTAGWAEMADLLYRAQLFVGIDTAAMHLAAACQCPIVALFGPTRPENWSPWRAEHVIVQPMLKDSQSSTSTESQRKSMDLIDSDQVIAACLKMQRKEAVIVQ